MYAINNINYVYSQLLVIHRDPESPLDDLSVLTFADYFIGNCVSSFSAFAARMRLQYKLPNYYFSFAEHDSDV